jgi:hypothetical protein
VVVVEVVVVVVLAFGEGVGAPGIVAPAALIIANARALHKRAL